MKKVYKRQIESIDQESACELCGEPVFYRDKYYEIENMEWMVFCCKACAIDYQHNAEY
jgi:hypothetical protein